MGSNLHSSVSEIFVLGQITSNNCCQSVKFPVVYKVRISLTLPKGK